MSCYISRVASMLRRLTLFALAACAYAQENPARDLAEKILGHLQARRAVYLDVRSITDADTADARRSLEAELRAQGVQLVPAAQAVEEVRVTLSASARENVWVAEIGRGEQREVAMVSFPRPSPALAPDGSGRLALRRTPLVADSAPILDVALTGDSLLALTSQSLSVYHNESGRWRRQNSVVVTATRPLPRDLRGRLLVHNDRVDISLPGVACTGSWQPDLALACRDSDDPWPLVLSSTAPVRAFFNPVRNFFTGVLSPPLANDVGPLFSAARLGDDANATWVIAGADGVARLTSSTGVVLSILTGWGSDVAAVVAPCGGNYVLGTRPVDDAGDALRVFQVSGRRATEAAAPLELSGAVTAFWPAPDGNSAIVVLRIAQTGDYEASSLSLSCSR